MESTLKRLIYIGIIAEWMDTGLLRKLGEHHEVGLVGEKRVPLPENVHYLGLTRYENLPAVMVQYEVGIIPFLRNELTLHINNSKIYQYYACGLPVVSTLDNIASREAGVLISETHADFLQNIEKTDSVARDELIQIAKANDWQAKADAFRDLLLQLTAA